jgi:hypothetical protein
MNDSTHDTASGACASRRDDRTVFQIVRQRDAIGFQDQHAPVAAIVGRNVALRRHDLVEARNVAEFGRERLVADVAPAFGKN